MEAQVTALMAEVRRLNDEVVSLTDANDHNVKAAQEWKREAEKASERTQYYKGRSNFMSFCLNGYKTECDSLQKEIKATHTQRYDNGRKFDKLQADTAILENKSHHQGWAEGYAAACSFHGVAEEGNTQVFTLEDRRAMQAKIHELECKLDDYHDEY
jgi:chromosome segregation ATPase